MVLRLESLGAFRQLPPLPLLCLCEVDIPPNIGCLEPASVLHQEMLDSNDTRVGKGLVWRMYLPHSWMVSTAFSQRIKALCKHPHCMADYTVLRKARWRVCPLALLSGPRSACAVDSFTYGLPASAQSLAYHLLPHV